MGHEQTFETIAPFTIEEAMKFMKRYQITTTITLKTNWATSLLQIVFHSKIAEEFSCFCFDEVVESICKKWLKGIRMSLGMKIERLMSSWPHGKY
ncbi:MAG: hypothetical protein CM15mP62_32530 [Rhodospirillaceae bacterium]|nr:MAG: hypothetical protein CM15mP62_32530 [Rhodospirillaceae bacterium]